MLDFPELTDIQDRSMAAAKAAAPSNTDALGIVSAGTDKRAVLFNGSDWPRIKDALIAHIEALA